MSCCEVCGSSAFRQEMVSDVFHIAGKPILVESIPATVCAQCGEMTFSRETTERLRRMLYQSGKPDRVATVDVYAFPA